MTIITSLRLDDIEGSTTFQPLPDITAHELALVMTMFMRMMLWPKDKDGNPIGWPDWRQYIMTYGLERHFREAP